jgi:hypothetical protein
VEEPLPGEFYWVILESKEDPTVWKEFSSALHGCPTWGDAWAQGVMEYMRLVRDRRFGPQSSGEDEATSSVG